MLMLNANDPDEIMDLIAEAGIVILMQTVFVPLDMLVLSVELFTLYAQVVPSPAYDPSPYADDLRFAFIEYPELPLLMI